MNSFNKQLKHELKKYEKTLTPKISPAITPIRKTNEPPAPKLFSRASEKVVSGDILWRPIDRQAAMLLAKSPWWAQPIEVKTFNNPKNAPALVRGREGNKRPRSPAAKHKKKKQMNDTLSMDTVMQQQANFGNHPSYTANSGLKVTMVNGEPMIRREDLHAVLCNEIANLPKEVRPNVKAAEDARRIIGELCEGIGGEMEKFKADTKRYLEDIRTTRFAMITEASQFPSALSRLRGVFSAFSNDLRKTASSHGRNKTY